MDILNEVPIGINYLTDTKPDENPYHYWRDYPKYYDFLKNEVNRNLGEKELRQELSFIKNQLHCNALKIMGHSIAEAVKIAKVSLKTGMTPWLCPRFIGATFDETKIMLQQYCQMAKNDHLENNPLVVANELPYDCLTDTLTGLNISSEYTKRADYLVENYFKKDIIINSTERIKQLIQIARHAGWTGLLTYAAFPGEQVDWNKVDDPNIVVGINLYFGKNHQTGQNWQPKDYDTKLKEIIKKTGNRQVVITEFGSVPQKNGSGGNSYTQTGPIDYEAQAAAYKSYLQVLQTNKVGYFAYAFHEAKEKLSDYGVGLHQSYGIALLNENNQINTLTPAGKVFAEYNSQTKT